MKLVSVSGAVVLVLQGCAVSPEKCDPDKEGLLNSSIGVLSGCYEQRTQADQQRNAREKELTTDLQKENDRLRIENKQQQQRLGAIQRRKTEIENEIVVLTDLLAERKESEALEERIAKYRVELDKLEMLERSLLE